MNKVSMPRNLCNSDKRILKKVFPLCTKVQQFRVRRAWIDVLIVVIARQIM